MKAQRNEETTERRNKEMKKREFAAEPD